MCLERNIYIQVIDDQHANILISISTLNKEIKNKVNYGGNVRAAKILGELTAEKLKQKGINKIVFDRGGYHYHGRVKTVAEGLRKGGIVF